MPDISLCANATCPLAHACYRYRAVPDMRWQSYANFSSDAKGRCKNFMRIVAGDKLKPLKKP